MEEERLKFEHPEITKRLIKENGGCGKMFHSGLEVVVCTGRKWEVCKECTTQSEDSGNLGVKNER